MTNEEIKENNAIIAEFMGLNVYADLDDYMFVSQRLSEKAAYINHLSYHHSWDALMPVIERITRLGIDFNEEGNRLFLEIGESFNRINLTHTYKKVVAFIKWYN